MSVIPNVMIMVPVSQQECVFVIKDGLEKTALKVGMYSQCIAVPYSHLTKCELKTQATKSLTID